VAELILGGARSGKSSFAEQRAVECGLRVVYIATAEAGDGEMAERIRHHQACRPDQWQSVEETIELAAVLEQNAAEGCCIIVDCLTLWLSNLMAAGDAVLVREYEALLALLPGLAGTTLLVSNEVGLGIVPDNELARRFRDEAGRLNQQLAVVCERVTFVAAGLPMVLKGS